VAAAEAVEDQEVKMVEEATAAGPKAEVAADNTTTVVVVASSPVVATATTVITHTITTTTNIMEAITVVIVVENREFEISKENKVLPLLVKVVVPTCIINNSKGLIKTIGRVAGDSQTKVRNRNWTK
jgi:hypothetical protein